jgi:prepilin-type N-terminal cleavage/methylation domain-containing protein
MCTVSSKRGFTLIEALVAVAIASTGIVAALGGLSSLNAAEVRLLDKEQMNRLAFEKYDELVATQSFSSTNGDFTDRNENRFNWNSTVSTTGVDNLSVLTVTVSPVDNSDLQETVNGLVFQPPQTTTTAAGAAGP